MHELPALIKDLAIILLIAGAVMILCQKLKQPLVLGYLIAGIIVGPYTVPYIYVQDTAGIQTTAELGMVFLMFSLGLEFSFHKLKRIGGTAVVIGFVEVIFMLIIGYGFGLLLGWPKSESMFLGAAISISSTTIIIKAFSELRLVRTRFAELVSGVLIVEDLLAILLLIGLAIFADPKSVFNTIMLARDGLQLILVVGGWFLIGYFLIPTIFKKWLSEAPDEIVTVVSIALCLLLVWLAAYFHYSIALGAFIMGSILAETDKSHRIIFLVQPLRDLFAAVFFVSIGMLIDPLEIWKNMGVVMIITGVTIMGKLLTSAMGALMSKERLITALQVGFSMAQIGEFSFIIASLGAGLGLLSPAFYPVIVAVSVITTFTTPYLIRFSYTGFNSMKKFQSLGTNVTLPIEKEPNGLKSKKRKNHAHVKGYLSRLFLNGIILAIVLIATQHFILSFLNSLTLDIVKINLIIFLVIFILCGPFIFAMLFSHELSACYRQNLVKSVFLKASALIITILELYFLLGNAPFSDKTKLLFILGWLMLIVIFHPALIKIYLWFEQHLQSNIKKIEE